MYEVVSWIAISLESYDIETYRLAMHPMAQFTNMD